MGSVFVLQCPIRLQSCGIIKASTSSASERWMSIKSEPLTVTRPLLWTMDFFFSRKYRCSVFLLEIMSLKKKKKKIFVCVFAGDWDIRALQLYSLHWLQYHYRHQQVLWDWDEAVCTGRSVKCSIIVSLVLFLYNQMVLQQSPLKGVSVSVGFQHSHLNKLNDTNDFSLQSSWIKTMWR